MSVSKWSEKCPMNPDAINSANRDYIDQLYTQYQSDPESLSDEWKWFFKGFDYGYLVDTDDKSSATVTVSQTVEDVQGGKNQPKYQRIDKGVVALVRAYRERGHYTANLNPLSKVCKHHPLLELSEYELSADDLDKAVGFSGFNYETDGSLRDLLEKLRVTYSGNIGIDTMYTSEKAESSWLEERMEPSLNKPSYPKEKKARILWQLIETEEFEQFLHNRYVGQKRFSIEGGESLLPLLDTLVESGSSLGVEEMVVGMAHRGRLNVLAHILHKTYAVILAEFEGAGRSEGAEDEGDVKYHQGFSYDFVTKQGQKMHLSLSPNPSHLELVNPIIEGMVQAKQDYLHDLERTRVVPVQIHGEAAFTGQGIVAETLNLSRLAGYSNGGTIHIIINNQLGYTATPEETRFTVYPTDVARSIRAPAFHVNADDPEAVVHVARMAMEFRQQFKKDVLIDLVCYRRHGHNEADDPTLTSPLMYRHIATHPTVANLYAKQVQNEGMVSIQEIDIMRAEVRRTLELSQEKAKRLKVKPRTNTFGGVWQGLTWAGDDWEAITAVDKDTLQQIGARATSVPEGFSLHRTLERLLKVRQQMVAGDHPVDWGCGEMLAFGSLLLERIPIRLSGQDCQRGTFAHRHAVWHDIETGEKHTPLADLAQGQGRFEVINSMLSELAVLGFEYGISSADPNRLIIWEAQFGDFANGAQLVIDQYISSAEAKWHRMCGITLLLPHGYEGMGPEHSSARLERYLQLCAKNNIQVVYPTTPAQLFHVLRRQMHRSFRKPLIVMSPKSLLRNKNCVSDIAEFTEGGFRNVVDDVRVVPEDVRRVVICTGKIYYDLLAGCEQENIDSVALVRVEQLYPFPENDLRVVFKRYPKAEDFLWVQEEALNMGSWYFIQPLIDEILPLGISLQYCGRDEAASPAVGDHTQHLSEQQLIVDETLNINRRELKIGQGTPPRAEIGRHGGVEG